MTVIAELPWSSSRRNIEENYLSTDPQNPKIQRQCSEGHKILNKRHQRSIASSAPVDHSIPSITTSQDWCRTRSMKPPTNELQKRSRLILQRCSCSEKHRVLRFLRLRFMYNTVYLFQIFHIMFQWLKSHQLIKSTHLRPTKPRPETWRRRSTICTISPSTKNMAVPSSNGKPQGSKSILFVNVRHMEM